jgi:hypothetical protein
MKKPERVLLLRLLFGMALASQAEIAMAQDYRTYQKSSQFRSEDYMLKSYGGHPDALFDSSPQLIDLGLNLAIGSDCGKVDFKSTIQSSLKNILDSKYWENVGKDIISASPMLLTCYMSPTWCAILKHGQVNASFLSNMRLNQCALIDRYTDKRTEDYEKERQDCTRKEISGKGGDLERAMSSCQGNVYSANIANWSGKSGGEKTATNKLIESSATWAGFTSPEAKRTTDLVKAFVGDTVVAQGNVSVEYGRRGKALTPETHLQGLQASIQNELCQKLLVRLVNEADRGTVDTLVSNRDLEKLAPGADEILVDRQTLEALSYMPERQRQAACKKLAGTVALTVFTKDVSRALDVLSIATQNPNLPPSRREEVEEKRRRLRESVELTLELEHQRNVPLRQVLTEINHQGSQFRDEYSEQVLKGDQNARRARAANTVFLDCGDGLLCEGG